MDRIPSTQSEIGHYALKDVLNSGNEKTHKFRITMPKFVKHDSNGSQQENIPLPIKVKGSKVRNFNTMASKTTSDFKGHGRGKKNLISTNPAVAMMSDIVPLIERQPANSRIKVNKKNSSRVSVKKASLVYTSCMTERDVHKQKSRN